MTHSPDPIDYLRRRGVPEGVIAGHRATFEQAEAWVADVAPIAVDARAAARAGDWDRCAHLQMHVAEKIAALGVAPDSPAGNALATLLVHASELARKLEAAGIDF